MGSSFLRIVLSLSLAGLIAACGRGDAPQPRFAPTATQTIGVNGYLWRAALETLSFMPLTQSDSAGGVIVTDWYTNPEAPQERIKVTVYILSGDLRADGVRVAAARQQAENGTWVDVPVRAGTVQQLEEAILARAREIHRSSLG